MMPRHKSNKATGWKAQCKTILRKLSWEVSVRSISRLWTSLIQTLLSSPSSTYSRTKFHSSSKRWTSSSIWSISKWPPHRLTTASTWMKTSVCKLQIWSPQWVARWTIQRLREPMTLRQTTITTSAKEVTITLSHAKAITIARWWRRPTATTNGWIQARVGSETLRADLHTAKALWAKLAQRLINLTLMIWSQSHRTDSSMWSLTLNSQRSKARITCGSQLR